MTMQSISGRLCLNQRFIPDLNYFCADTETELQHSGYQSITRQA